MRIENNSLIIAGSEKKLQQHLTGSMSIEDVSNRLNPVDNSTLRRKVTPLITKSFMQKGFHGGIIIIGSLTDSELQKYNDIDMIVASDNLEDESMKIASLLSTNFNKSKLAVKVKRNLVPSITGGEFLPVIYAAELNNIAGCKLRTLKSSIFEIHPCASFELAYFDYLEWLDKSNISYCNWLRI